MEYDLVVTSAFGAYGVGTHITDPAVIAAIEASPNRVFTVRAARATSGGDGGGTPPAPLLLATDVLMLMRDGIQSRAITLADLAAFLGATGGSGGGSGSTTGGTGQADFSNPDNSGVAGAL